MEHFTSQKGVAAVLGVLDDMFGHADNAPSSGESSEESDHTYMSESVSSSFSSVESIRKPPSGGTSGSASLFPQATFPVKLSAPLPMVDPHGDDTPLSSNSASLEAHEPGFLKQLEAEMKKLSDTQKECSQEYKDSRDRLEEELLATHIKQSAQLEDKLAQAQEKQAELQEELLIEQRKHGARITELQQELSDTRKQQEKRDSDRVLAQEQQDSKLDSLLANITKKLEDSSITRAQEHKDHAAELAALTAINAAISTTNANLTTKLNTLTDRLSLMEFKQTQTEDENQVLTATVADVRSWLVSKVIFIYIPPPLG